MPCHLSRSVMDRNRNQNIRDRQGRYGAVSRLTTPRVTTFAFVLPDLALPPAAPRSLRPPQDIQPTRTRGEASNHPRRPPGLARPGGRHMGIEDRQLDTIRSDSTELENHYIDELVAGRLDRRSFLRRGAVLGMSASVMGAVLAACGGANNSGGSGASATQAGSSSTSSAPATKGGTLKLALQAPSGAINPLTVADAGGLCILAQTGEFLTFDNNIKTHL